MVGRMAPLLRVNRKVSASQAINRFDEGLDFRSK